MSSVAVVLFLPRMCFLHVQNPEMKQKACFNPLLNFWIFRRCSHKRRTKVQADVKTALIRGGENSVYKLFGLSTSIFSSLFSNIIMAALAESQYDKLLPGG